MFSFTTRNVDLDMLDLCPEIKSLDLKQVEVNNQKVHITWKLELELRGWGLKYSVISVPEQIIEFYVDIEDENEAKLLSVNIKDCETDTEAANFDGPVYPRTLQFYKGKWTLIF